MSNNNSNEEKPNKLMFIVVTIVAVLLPFTIFGAVYCINISQMPILYDKKDVLGYYGSIVGACFTGFITAGGLYYTLNQNYKSINKQRDFDQNALEEQRKQFNKDYNLRLINQKLDTYKEIFLLTEEIINKAISINHKIVLRQHLTGASMVTGKSSIHSNHISDIEELYELSNKYNFMLVFITEESIVNLSKEAFKILEKAIDKKNNREKDEINDSDYAEYYIKISTSYTKVSQSLKQVSKDIYLNNVVKDMNIEYSN